MFACVYASVCVCVCVSIVLSNPRLIRTVLHHSILQHFALMWYIKQTRPPCNLHPLHFQAWKVYMYMYSTHQIQGSIHV